MDLLSCYFLGYVLVVTWKPILCIFYAHTHSCSFKKVVYAILKKTIMFLLKEIQNIMRTNLYGTYDYGFVFNIILYIFISDRNIDGSQIPDLPIMSLK